MAGRRAFETSLAIAVALHLLGLALLPRGGRKAAPHVEAPKAQQIEIETTSGGSARRSGQPVPSRGAAAPADRRVAMVGRWKHTGHADVTAAPAEPQADTATGTAPGAPPAQGPASHPGLDQLGMGFDNPLLRRAAGSTRAGPARRRNAAPGIARSLAQAETDHDARIGLGPGGPIVGAFETAARRAPGPMNSRALFAATIDASGKLRSIDVLEVSSGYASWKAIARRAAAAIARRRLHKPTAGRPVRLTIEVVARKQLPSGADPGLAVDIAGIPLKKGEGKKSARLSILPLPKAQVVHVTTPDGSYDLPWVTTPIPGLSLVADPADIGSGPRRMVHAHVVSTTVL